MPPKLGVVLGSRRLQLMTEGFRAGQVLLVRAAVFAEDDATTILDGEVTDAETRAVLASGRVSVYTFADPGRVFLEA